MKNVLLILLILLFCKTANPYTSNQYVHILPEVTVTATRIYPLERLTVYNPKRSQTDRTPDRTSIGAKIDTRNPLKHRWIAVSQDMLEQFPYGSKVLITGTGKYDGVWTVMDCMNKRYTQSADILTHHKTGRWLNGEAKIQSWPEV